MLKIITQEHDETLVDLYSGFFPLPFSKVCILIKSSLSSCIYSGLNFIDLMVRQGNIDNPPKTPLVPGFECSGIIEALGENVKGYEVM